MTRVDLTPLIVTGLLSGSLFAALATLVTSRTTARKTDAERVALVERAPAERDNIIVTGAEAAVLTMKAALDSAQGRIAELERDRESDRRRMADLETRHAAIAAALDVAEAALAEARLIGDELARQLRDLRAERA